MLWTAGGFWEKESQFFFTGAAAGLLTMLRKAPHLEMMGDINWKQWSSGKNDIRAKVGTEK